MLKFPWSPQAIYSIDSPALLFRKIFPNVWPNSSHLKCRHTPPDDSGCLTWLSSLQTAAVLPSDHSLLCSFWQILFLALSRALFSLLYPPSHHSTSSPSNSIQTLCFSWKSIVLTGAQQITRMALCLKTILLFIPPDTKKVQYFDHIMTLPT